MKKRVLAYYLPQFHQTPENDAWWGQGYTEWTATGRWQPLYEGHRLRRPSSLGHYNLLDPAIVDMQGQLAEAHGVEAFCYWTYWFGGGEMLLDKPLANLLLHPPKIKYCISWANHSWFNKSKWLMLKEQKYLGADDYRAFYETLRPHFLSGHYMMVGKRPVVGLYLPTDIPDFDVFHSVWTELALKDGLDGIYFLSDIRIESFAHNGLIDAFTNSLAMFENRHFLQKVRERLVRRYNWGWLGPVRYSYPGMMNNIYRGYNADPKFVPTLFSGWDTTPRHGRRGVVLDAFSEEAFRRHARDVMQMPSKDDLLVIKSWNEWAEGNLLEPDDIYGESLLHILRDENRP